MTSIQMRVVVAVFLAPTPLAMFVAVLFGTLPIAGVQVRAVADVQVRAVAGALDASIFAVGCACTTDAATISVDCDTISYTRTYASCAVVGAAAAANYAEAGAEAEAEAVASAAVVRLLQVLYFSTLASFFWN